MIGKDVILIEYSKKVDFFNCLTHAVGAALAEHIHGFTSFSIFL